MGRTEPTTWYSVTIDVAASDTWRPLDAPCTQIYEGDADALAEQVVADYYLDEPGAAWRVRVYAGYNRYDDLLSERAGI